MLPHVSLNFSLKAARSARLKFQPLASLILHLRVSLDRNCETILA